MSASEQLPLAPKEPLIKEPLIFKEVTKMGLLAWLVVGLIAGFLAGQFVKGSGFGLIGDIVVGVIGALVGGWLAATFLNMPDAISGFNLTTIVVAFLGAVLLLFVVRLFSRYRR